MALGVLKNLADEYVKEGMQCFVDGKYSRFVRHGGMLAYVLDSQVARAILWTGQMHRPTRDLDLLGFGDSSAAALRAVFRVLCSVAEVEDGLDFAADTIVVEPIREDQEYGGQRVRLEVRLGNVRIDLQIDDCPRS
jgi:Nucleotidyl transferase AbiEii toxin, Type IV TA system